MLKSSELFAVPIEIDAQLADLVLDSVLTRGEFLDFHEQLYAAHGVGAGSDELAGFAREARANLITLSLLASQLGFRGSYNGSGLVDLPAGLVGVSKIALQLRRTDCGQVAALSAETIS
jgi:hypothetical protein